MGLQINQLSNKEKKKLFYTPGTIFLYRHFEPLITIHRIYYEGMVCYSIIDGSDTLMTIDGFNRSKLLSLEEARSIANMHRVGSGKKILRDYYKWTESKIDAYRKYMKNDYREFTKKIREDLNPERWQSCGGMDVPINHMDKWFEVGNDESPKTPFFTYNKTIGRIRINVVRIITKVSSKFSIFTNFFTFNYRKYIGQYYFIPERNEKYFKNKKFSLVELDNKYYIEFYSKENKLVYFDIFEMKYSNVNQPSVVKYYFSHEDQKFVWNYIVEQLRK